MLLLQEGKRREQAPEFLSRRGLATDRHQLPRVFSVAFENGAVTHPVDLEPLPQTSERGLVGTGERHRMSVIRHRARFARCVNEVRRLKPRGEVSADNAVVGDRVLLGAPSDRGTATGEGFSGGKGNGARRS